MIDKIEISYEIDSKWRNSKLEIAADDVFSDVMYAVRKELLYMPKGVTVTLTRAGVKQVI